LDTHPVNRAGAVVLLYKDGATVSNVRPDFGILAKFQDNSIAGVKLPMKMPIIGMN
jgi:hypothetical protein